MFACEIWKPFYVARSDISCKNCSQNCPKNLICSDSNKYYKCTSFRLLIHLAFLATLLPVCEIKKGRQQQNIRFEFTFCISAEINVMRLSKQKHTESCSYSSWTDQISATYPSCSMERKKFMRCMCIRYCRSNFHPFSSLIIHFSLQFCVRNGCILPFSPFKLYFTLNFHFGKSPEHIKTCNSRVKVSVFF